MGLVLPPFYFVNGVDNFTGTPGSAGTSFTAGASNADAAAVSILSALSFDVHYLIVGISGIIAGSPSNADSLLDVLIDPAGGTSWSSFVDDLMCGNTSASPCAFYHFPVFIKSGTSIGVQARTAQGSDITLGRVQMYAYGNPSRPERWWCGSKVETLGSTPASSRGTTVTPGATGTYGSWTDIGSTTSARYGAIQLGVNGTTGTSAARGYYWQMGYSSTQLPGSPTVYASTVTSSETMARTGLNQLIWCDIPSGTQMQARATCSSTAADSPTVAFYGVY